MSDHFDAYSGVHARVVQMVADLGTHELGTVPRATPEWTVHDIVAHMVGVTSDVVSGNIGGAGTDPWTAVQVEDRRDVGLVELLAEWERNLPSIREIAAVMPPEITGQLVFDAVTHEHDLRHALAAVGEQSSDAVAIGFWWICTSSAGRVSEALTLETEIDSVQLGPGAPVGRVRASRFELLRAITGRRSLRQIASLDWDGEPRADLLVVSPPFAARADDLVEQA